MSRRPSVPIVSRFRAASDTVRHVAKHKSTMPQDLQDQEYDELEANHLRMDADLRSLKDELAQYYLHFTGLCKASIRVAGLFQGLGDAYLQEGLQQQQDQEGVSGGDDDSAETRELLRAFSASMEAVQKLAVQPAAENYMAGVLKPLERCIEQGERTKADIAKRAGGDSWRAVELPQLLENGEAELKPSLIDLT
jgi:hypothetical protein